MSRKARSASVQSTTCCDATRANGTLHRESHIDATRTNRPVAPLPGPPGERIPLLIDTDAANEIDDLYAIALALRSPDRFDIAGFVATHFAAARGRESIAESYEAIREVLEAAQVDYPVAMGGDPLCYPGEPRESEGARFIIQTAQAMPAGTRLLVLALGAASNVASALLLEPSIAARVTVMFHGRSEETWPERSTQFNITGDIIAARHLLESRAPLIWFDTGTSLVAPISETETRLAPAGRLGSFLHDYRYRREADRPEPLLERGHPGSHAHTLDVLRPHPHARQHALRLKDQCETYLGSLLRPRRPPLTARSRRRSTRARRFGMSMKLMSKLARGEQSAEEEGWMSLEEVETQLGLDNA